MALFLLQGREEEEKEEEEEEEEEEQRKIWSKSKSKI